MYNTFRDIIWLHNEQPLQHIDCDGNSPDQEYCMMTSVKSRLCIKSSNMVGEFRCQADNGHGVAISDKTLVHKAGLCVLTSNMYVYYRDNILLAIIFLNVR